VHQDWRANLDGQVYAEPLVFDGHVFAATENDTVYSLDAATGAVEWSTHLGSPVPQSALPCGNVDPSGITGTPVVDPADGAIWVVALVTPGSHELFSLDLASGKVRSQQAVALPGVDPLAEQQRGALFLGSGSVYAGFGGLFGDCGNYKGFVVSFSTSGEGAQTTFAVPTSRGGAIWSPAGPVAAGNGELFVATGNSASETSYDDGNSVLRLSASLQKLDSFAPSDWASLNGSDLDLGSLSPALVGGDRLMQVGKGGDGYLLDTAHLGGVGGQLYSAQVCPGPAFGATAVDGSVVFVPCGDGLRAVRVGPGDSFSVEWSAPSPAPVCPVVAGGMVWGVTRSGRLVGLDEQSGRVGVNLPVGSIQTSFPSLSSAGGRIFAQGGDAVVAFGGI
jgi:outer membrane protein assembly factor BamB